MFEYLGLEYMTDVCSAVEKYTKFQIERDRKAFIYRGMNLRYAIERALYIHCINSRTLYQHYINNKHKIIKSSTPKLNKRDLEIWRIIENKSKTHTQYIDNAKQLVESSARRLIELSRINVKKADQFHKCESKDILFQINNIKFARYLKPITDKLTVDSFAYLTLLNKKLERQLNQEGYQVINYSLVPNISERIFCSGSLSLFMPLLREVDILLQAINKIRPKCVVVVEGNSSMDAITSEVCRVFGIPCLCIQQGWSPFIHNGFRNMRYTEMFVWGKRFAELLKPYNPEQKFTITGSHAVSRRAVEELEIERKRKVISFFLQAPGPLISKSNFADFLNLIVDVSTEQLDTTFIVRPHPNYPLPDQELQRLSQIQSLIVSLPTVETIKDVLEKSDLAVSIFSTVLLEAIAMDVVPLICSIGAINKYQPSLAESGIAIEVHSVQEARDMINKIITDDDIISNVKKKIKSAVGEYFEERNSAKIISDHIRGMGEFYKNEHDNKAIVSGVI